MNKSDFNFKQYQQYKKNWKMLVRFVIYSIVIAFLMYLIFNKERKKDRPKNQEVNKPIDIEIDEVETE